MPELYDNLGRKIDAAKMSIGELKGLVGTLMKSKVGPAKPIGGQEEEAKTQDSNLELIKLFEDYVKGFNEEVDEQKSLLQNIVDALKNINSKKEEKANQPKDNKEEKDEIKETFPEKLRKALTGKNKPSKEEHTTAKATNSLANLFGKKGSGYTHDIHCEAWLRQIYQVLAKDREGVATPEAAARQVEEDVTRVTAREPAETAAREASEAATTGGGETIRARDWLDAEEYYQELNGLENDYYQHTVDSIFGLWNKEKDLYERITGLEKEKNAIHRAYLKEGISKEEKERLALAYRQMGIEISNQKIIKRNLKEQENAWKEIGKQIETAEKYLLGFKGGGAFEVLTKGIIKEEREFTQNIRQAAYETAGVTSESKALQKTYEEIGKTSKLTGMNRSETQKAYTKALRSGVKDQKKALSLSVSQLNTEKQIGATADSLGEFFIEMGTQLQFNNDQMSEVGRGIREAGRNTGLVGDKLAGVVRGSAEFVKMMKNAGTASASAVSNIVGLQAEFTKTGVEGGKLLKGLSSTSGFLGSDAQTLALIANAANRVGLTQEMINGTILKSSASIKKFNRGLTQTVNDMGLGGRNAEEMRANFDKLSDEGRRDINLRLNAAFGMEAGELMLAIEGIENQSKSLSDRLGELNKKKSQNLTLEEKATLLEEERSLKLGAATKALTAISEAAKGTKDMNEALAKFSSRRSEFEGDMKALGQSWTTETDVARGAIKSALENVNAGLKKAGKKELKIDSSEIEKAIKDPAAFRELTSQITKGEQELATAQKAQLDPLSAIEQKLTEINDSVRNLSQSLISGIFNSFLGKMLVGITALGALIVGAIGGLNSIIMPIWNLMTLLGRSLSGMGQRTSQDRMGSLGKVWDRLTGRDTTPTPERLTEAEVTATGKDKTITKTGCCEDLVSINKAMLDVLNAIKDCVCGKQPEASTQASQTKQELREAELTPKSVVSPDQVAAGKAGEVAKKEVGTDLASKSVVSQPPQTTPEKIEEAVKKESRKPKLSPEEIATRKAAGQAAKERSQTAGISPSVAKSIKRQEVKNIKMDASLNKMQRRNIIQELQNGKKTKTMILREQEAAKGPKPLEVPQPPDTGNFDLNKLIASGQDMAKSAAAVALLGLGVVALGAAIVFLSKKILSGFNLDTSTILQTAGAIAALAVAGGAIAAAGIVAYEALNKKENKEFVDTAPKSKTEMLKQIAAMMLLGPALVLLGAAIVKMSQMVIDAFGLDLNTVAMVAGTVAAIVAAAGALTLGASEALEGFEKLEGNKLIKNPGKLVSAMAKGALALLIVGPGLVALSAAIIKMCQGILSYAEIDLNTIKTVTGQVAALLAGTGAIALGITAAAGGLILLGKFADFAKSYAKDMIIGAAALILIGPAVVALAAGLNYIINQILSATGVDAAKAAKTAWNVAGLIAATAVIALAVMGAMAGLTALGALATAMTGPQIGFMLYGAAALLLLAPLVTGLAAAVLYLTKSFMGGFDAKQATKVAYDLSAVLMSASVIAIAVMAAMAGLGGLGVLAAGLPAYIPAMLGGAAALMLLTPVMTALATSVIGMTESIMDGIDAKHAAKVAYDLGSIIMSAGSIALGIMGAMAALTGLGLLAGAYIGFIGPMIGGALALSVMTPAVVTLAGSIISMSESLMKNMVSPDAAKKTVESLNSILDSAGNIAVSIIANAASLALLGTMFGVSLVAIPFMKLGTMALSNLTPSIANFVNTIVNMAKQFSTLVSPKEAVSLSKDVAAIMGAVGDISEQIFKIKDKMLSVPVYGSVWNAIRGVKVADYMNSGVKALKELAAPVQDYVAAIKDFALNVGRTVNPRNAAEMARGVAAILCAVSNVTSNMMTAKDGILSIPKNGGIFATLTRTRISDYLNAGVGSLQEMAAPIKRYVAAVKKFASEIGFDPRQAAEMASGVAAILCAVGKVTSNIMTAKDGIMSIPDNGGIFAWMLGAQLSQRMNKGVEALKVLGKPIQRFVKAIKDFSSKLGNKLPPSQAAGMAKGIADILSGASEVTKQIMETKDKIIGIKSARGWGFFRKDYVVLMETGRKALVELSKPIINYIESIRDFASQVGARLDPRLAASMARGVADVLTASGDVTEGIMKTKDKLVTIKSSEGFWLWSTSIADSMKAGVVALNTLKQPLMSYLDTIVTFSNELKDKINPTDAKKAVKSITSVSEVIDMISKVMNDLGSKIAPMTQGGWFTSSPVEQIKEAKTKMDAFFPVLSSFITSIVSHVDSSLGESKSLKGTVKSMGQISELLNNIKPVVDTMMSSIVPMTQGGFFKGSAVDSIKGAIPQLNQFFESISSFILNGLVNPIKKSAESIDDLKETGKRIVVIADVLKGTKTSIDSLSSMMTLMQDGIFTNSPIKTISNNITGFSDYFNAISNFVSSGLIEPITKMGEVSGLSKAKGILITVGNFLCATKLTIESLAGVIGLLDSKSVFSSSPIDNIINNKDKFRKHFLAIADLVKNGIAEPVALMGGDGTSLGKAAKVITAMASIACRIVPLIKNLATAVSMATDKTEFFSVAPMQKIIDAKGQFAVWFQQIAAFVRDGIVLPVNNEMEGVNIGSAAKNISSMTSIAGSVMPLIKNLANVMGMMSEDAAKSLDTEFPIDKIISYKDSFAIFFRQTAGFIRDGVIAPIVEEIKDTQEITKASRILNQLSSNIVTIPKVIKGVSEGLIPLVEVRSGLAPMEVIADSAKDFEKWFTKVAVFIRDGVVTPIVREFEGTQDIILATRILNNISSMISALPKVITSLSSVFVGLNAKSCLSESPIGMLATNAETFKAWFRSVTSLIQEGIIKPSLEIMPDNSLLKEVKVKLALNEIAIRAVTPWLNSLSSSIQGLSGGIFWRIFTGIKVSKFSKNFMYMASLINDGLIKPIKKNLASSAELEEVTSQLDGLVDVVDRVTFILGILGTAFNNISPVKIDVGKMFSVTGSIRAFKEAINEEAKDKLALSRQMQGELQEVFMAPEKMMRQVSEKAVGGTFEAKAVEPIIFGDAEDIQDSIGDAKLTALAKLSEKLGRSQLSGVEYEVKVSKDFVEATAKWSKENEDAALGLKKSMDALKAGEGGAGRSNLPIVPAPAARIEPAQAATKAVEMEKDEKFQRDMKIFGKGKATEKYYRRKSLEEAVTKNNPTVQQDRKQETAQSAANAGVKAYGEKSKPLTVEYKVDILFMHDSANIRESLEEAATEAKAMIAERLGVKEVLGSQVKIEYSIDKKTEQAIATATYTPDNKFSEFLTEQNRRVAGVPASTNIIPTNSGRTKNSGIGDAVIEKGMLEASAREAIIGKTEIAIEVAERKAEDKARKALGAMMAKSGIKDFIGIEVDSEIEGNIVKATARWSEEAQKEAKGLRESFETLGASKGGLGRAGMLQAQEPAQAATQASTQAATQATKTSTAAFDQFDIIEQRQIEAENRLLDAAAKQGVSGPLLSGITSGKSIAVSTGITGVQDATKAIKAQQAQQATKKEPAQAATIATKNSPVVQQAQKMEPAQAAVDAGVRSASEKSKPLTVEYKVDILFMHDSANIRESLEEAATEAKAMIAERLGVKEVLGSQVKIEYSIDKETEQAIAKATYTPDNKFSEFLTERNRRAAGVPTSPNTVPAKSGAAKTYTFGDAGIEKGMLEASAREAIIGKTEIAIEVAERKAEIKAREALGVMMAKSGIKDFIGIEVDSEIEGNIVKATARWSEEAQKEAKGLRESFETLGASKGGLGRGGMQIQMQEPAQTATAATQSNPVVQQATKPEPAQAATKAVEMEKDEKFQRDMRVFGRGKATDKYYRRKSLEEAVAKSNPTVQQATRTEPAQAATASTNSNPVVQQATRTEPAQAATQIAQPMAQPQSLPAQERFLITKDVKTNKDSIEVVLRKELKLLDDEELEEEILTTKVFEILKKKGISPSGVNLDTSLKQGILEVKATTSPEDLSFSEGLSKEFSRINAGGGGVGRSAIQPTIAQEQMQAANQVVAEATARMTNKSESSFNAAEKMAILDLKGTLLERNIPQSSVDIETAIEGKFVKAVAKLKQNEIEPAQAATQVAQVQSGNKRGSFLEASGQALTIGRTEEDWDLAEDKATDAAMGALKQMMIKSGFGEREISGIEVESQVDEKTGIVKAVARWSDEVQKSAQAQGASYEALGAGKGGLGRGGIQVQEPAQAATTATLADISGYFSSTGTKPEPAQAVTQIATEARIKGRTEAAIGAAEKVAILDLKGILLERNMPQSSVDIDTKVEATLVRAIAKFKQNDVEPAQAATQKAANAAVPSANGNIESVVPNTDVDTSKALPSTATPVPVSTISPSASIASIEQKMLQDKAAASPAKAEITSPELGNIVSENEEQTIILSEMRDLFEKFLAAIKPRSDINSSGGGEPGNTSSIPIAGKPANYYRRVTGNVSQTPGKGVVNLGAKALS
jgi:hypothetical protein